MKTINQKALLSSGLSRLSKEILLFVIQIYCFLSRESLSLQNWRHDPSAECGQ